MARDILRELQMYVHRSIYLSIHFQDKLAMRQDIFNKVQVLFFFKCSNQQLR